MTAEGVPGHIRVVLPHGGHPGGGESAPLVPGCGPGVLDPAEAAAAADLVVDAEHPVEPAGERLLEHWRVVDCLVVAGWASLLVLWQVGGPAAPAGPFCGGRVLPGRREVRFEGPARLLAADPSGAEPAQPCPCSRQSGVRPSCWRASSTSCRADRGPGVGVHTRR